MTEMTESVGKPENGGGARKGRGGERQAPPWLPRVFLGLAVAAVVGALVIALRPQPVSVDLAPVSAVVVAGLLPWILLGVHMAFRIREPRSLVVSTAGGKWPSVSVIIPARNEVANLPRLLGSLAAQDYPDYEVILVDDGSDDGTGELARGTPPGNARRIHVVDGQPLPEGWFGKPWACHQGAEEATGRILLFTDADTYHAPELLRAAVLGFQEDEAQALSLVGRQEMETFGERLVQPQLFTLLGLRFPRMDQHLPREKWEGAIANGQYIMVAREAYEAMGGHAAVRGEVVEDLRLAQELVRGGFRLTLRRAEELFSTRMYTSLRELVNGWTKNLAMGARQSAGWWGGLALPGMVMFLLVMWVLPPVVLLASLAGVAGPSTDGVMVWSGVATLFSATIWAGAYHRFQAPIWMAVLFPLGALVTVFIALRSAMRGEGRIEWKGRRYREGVVVEGGDS
ncbi:MAG: glycosyltransferase [Gemmatimonadota bacterium]